LSEAPSVRTILQFGENVSSASCPAESDFQAWVEAAVAAADYSAALPVTATIRVVAEDEGMKLNADYRGKDRATNVLAFPVAVPPIPQEALEELELGDLVICFNVADREAREQGKSLSQHLAHLTVHGTLHLLGLDHVEDADAEAMEGLERQILAGLGIPDPYA